MDPTKTGPIALAEQRLRWTEARQRVLAQNIANADTPNYRPSDMQPFAKVLSGKLTEKQMVATNAIICRARASRMAARLRNASPPRVTQAGMPCPLNAKRCALLIPIPPMPPRFRCVGAT